MRRGEEGRARRTIGNGEIGGGIRILRKREIEREGEREGERPLGRRRSRPLAHLSLRPPPPPPPSVRTGAPPLPPRWCVVGALPFPLSARWRHSEV